MASTRKTPSKKAPAKPTAKAAPKAKAATKPKTAPKKAATAAKPAPAPKRPKLLDSLLQTLNKLQAQAKALQAQFKKK